ncbi:protein phosphatase 2C domain-containing protein [Microbacterium oxydans]|nr:protein phosphatase 2C domain-containing protein [Microbacterium oxydans]
MASVDGGQVKIELLERLLAKVSTLAERHGRDIHDFASTFLGVAVSGDKFLGAHIGDGVIGYLKNGELHVISAPDNSEFANQTTFVTSQGAAASMRLFRGSLQGVTGFILMSDGAGGKPVQCSHASVSGSLRQDH